MVHSTIGGLVSWDEEITPAEEGRKSKRRWHPFTIDRAGIVMKKEAIEIALKEFGKGCAVHDNITIEYTVFEVKDKAGKEAKNDG